MSHTTRTWRARRTALLGALLGTALTLGSAAVATPAAVAEPSPYTSTIAGVTRALDGSILTDVRVRFDNYTCDTHDDSYDPEDHHDSVYSDSVTGRFEFAALPNTCYMLRMSKFENLFVASGTTDINLQQNLADRLRVSTPRDVYAYLYAQTAEGWTETNSGHVSASEPTTFTVTPGRTYAILYSGSGVPSQWAGGVTGLWNQPPAGATMFTIPTTDTVLDVTLSPQLGSTAIWSDAPADTESHLLRWDSESGTWEWVSSASRTPDGTAEFWSTMFPGQHYSVARNDAGTYTWAGGFVGNYPSLSEVVSVQAPAAGQIVTLNAPAPASPAHQVTVTLDGFLGSSPRVYARNLITGGSLTTPLAEDATSVTIPLPSGTWMLEASDYSGYKAMTVITVTGDQALTLTGARAAVEGSFRLGLSGTVRVGETLAARVTAPADATVQSYWSDGRSLFATGNQALLGTAQLGREVQVTAVIQSPTAGPYSDYYWAGTVRQGTAPTLSSAPTVAGSAVVGQTLSIAGGAWNRAHTGLTVQWLRGGSPVPGATAGTYALTAADLGAQISAQVTPIVPGHATAATTTTAATAAVVPAPVATAPAPAPTPAAPAGPADPADPAITGKAKAGATLTAPAPTKGAKATYAWTRNGKTIKGATKRTYKVTTADAGTKIAVKITEKRGKTTTKHTITARTIAKITPTVTATGATKAITVKVSAKGIKNATGKVTVTYGKKTRTVALKANTKGTVKVTLPRGTHAVKVTYRGTSQIAAKTTKVTKIHVK